MERSLSPPQTGKTKNWPPALLLESCYMDKRYTVFVSSTYTDMIDERNAVIQAIMRQGHIPLGMEAFGAANASSWKVITKTIDAADYYVLLIARRYGSINKTVDMGYTEQEFWYAVEQDVPVLVFLLDEAARWPGISTDTDADAVHRLRKFRESASTDRQVAFWHSKADLPFMVMTDLGNSFSDDPRPGWVRPTPQAGQDVLEELARLSKENAELKERFAEIDRESDLERYKLILNKKKFTINNIERSAYILFVRLARLMVSEGTRYQEAVDLVAEISAVPKENKDMRRKTSEIIDFLSNIGLIVAQSLGVRPVIYVGDIRTGGEIQYSYAVTQEGHRLLSDISIKEEMGR